jgi:hypothetical protein
MDFFRVEGQELATVQKCGNFVDGQGSWQD